MANASTTPHETSAFHHVSEMEDHLRIIRDLMTGLSYMADSIDGAGGAVATIADLAKDHCADAERLRAYLFRETHPDKARIERDGRPG